MNLDFFTWAGLGSALLIFCLRVADMSLDTIRVLFVVRSNRRIAWILGFFQTIIYVVAISSVLGNLDNPLNVIGYAAGFATGNVVGMIIDDRLAIGHVHLSVISSTRGNIIAEQLREAGFAVTEIPARGRDGTVSMLSVSVLRKDVSRVETIALEADSEVFITKEDVHPVRRGFWGI